MRSFDLAMEWAARRPKQATPDPVWPQESLDCAARFGHDSARLFPFLGARVVTPRGPGELRQVLGDVAAVCLDRQTPAVELFSCRDVLPVATK